jgi:hypothetical protein
MNHRSRFLSCCLLSLLPACQQEGVAPATAPVAQEAPGPVGPPDQIEAGGLLQRIGILSSDEFGGRAPMSEGERLTLNYLESQFREMGLEPMFGDSYRQAVPLVAIEAYGDLTLSVRGDGVDLAYGNGPEATVWTKRVVEETGLDDSELVWAGYGIVAPEYGWDDYAGLDVAGKTVIVLVNDPGYATQDPERFNGNAMTYYGRWTYKYEEAARQGAAGILIVHETAAAGYGWNVIEDGRQGPQFDLARDNGNMNRVRVEGWLQHDVAEEILAGAGLDLAELERQAAQGSVSPVPLGLTASVTIRNRIRHAESFNVGALRRGAARPEELFIYTAHWDHMGTAPHNAGAQRRVPGGHRGGIRPARLTGLHGITRLPDEQDRRWHQHGPAEFPRQDERRGGDRPRRLANRGHPGRSGAGNRPHGNAGGHPGEGLLLPLRPLQFRQEGRAVPLRARRYRGA